jgi:hypothetical protein
MGIKSQEGGAHRPASCLYAGLAEVVGWGGVACAKGELGAAYIRRASSAQRRGMICDPAVVCGVVVCVRGGA